jgi:hypothetical protein
MRVGALRGLKAGIAKSIALNFADTFHWQKYKIAMSAWIQCNNYRKTTLQKRLFRFMSSA